MATAVALKAVQDNYTSLGLLQVYGLRDTDIAALSVVYTPSSSVAPVGSEAAIKLAVPACTAGFAAAGACLDFENEIAARATASAGLYALRNVSGFSTANGSVVYGEYQNYTGNIRYVELQYDDAVDLIATEQTGKVGETQVRLSSATVSRELTEAEAKVWTT